MFLIVGLGNPGIKYQKTWHNIGFRAVDEIPKRNNLVMAKPQSFMNNSGKTVKVLIKHYKLNPENLIIIHDDIDLPLGKFKIQKNRGSAGHKGVQSIIKELGTKNFWRIRIGICPQKGKPKNIEKFVLKKITKEEKTIKEIIKKTAEAIDFFYLVSKFERASAMDLKIKTPNP